jgi:hypothetical protein
MSVENRLARVGARLRNERNGNQHGEENAFHPADTREPR